MSERTPRIIPPEGLRFQQPYNGTLPRELAPLEDPGWVPLAEADHMRDADPVIVVTPSECSYVVPWWVLKNHHVANLLLEGNPVTVTLCERCSSSTALDARVDGEQPMPGPRRIRGPEADLAEQLVGDLVEQGHVMRHVHVVVRVDPPGRDHMAVRDEPVAVHAATVLRWLSGRRACS